MVLCSHLLGAQYVTVYILMHQLCKAVDYLGTIREPYAYRSVDRLGASNMIVFTLVPTSVSIAVGHRARVLSVNVHGLSYGQTFGQSIIEICERNPMVLPFKWNLIQWNFTWPYLSLRIFLKKGFTEERPLILLLTSPQFVWKCNTRELSIFVTSPDFCQEKTQPQALKCCQQNIPWYHQFIPPWRT